MRQSNLLDSSCATAFMARSTLKFEAGKIVIINKNQTLKPSELPGQPGEKEDETLQHQETCSDKRGN
jgi:hypothetical protein